MADTLDEILCPACGKAMKKVFLEDKNFNLDVCLDGCGGIFFDNREYKQVLKEEDIAEFLNLLEGKNFETVYDGDKRTCPLCGSTMVKNYANISERVLIDECYNCGGVFLDNGELQKIKAKYGKIDTRAEEARKRADERFNAFRSKFL